MNRVFVLLLIFLCSLSTMAKHIVGGDLSITKTTTAGRNFRVTLNLYIDEHGKAMLPAGANSTNSVYIFKKKDNQLVTQLYINLIPQKHLNFDNPKCAELFDIHVYKSTYTREFNLNLNDYADKEGYYIVYEECCRGVQITNIQNPRDVSFYIRLDFPSLKDNPNYSSPEFTVPNGEFLCTGKSFKSNFSALDANGDQLIYRLIDPMVGYTTETDFLYDGTPYSSLPNIKWVAGINKDNAIPGNPVLSIDKNTGILSVTPNNVGVYVFAVEVEEFSNGNKLGINRRDFILPVVNCPNITPPKPSITVNSAPLTEIEICQGQNVTLETAFDVNSNYQWQRSSQNITNGINSTVAVSDSGSYTVVRTLKNVCSNEISSDEVKVKFATNPKIIINTNQACEGDKITLKLENSNQTVEWYSGSTLIKKDKSIEVTKSGEYIAKPVSGLSCSTVQDKIQVSFLPKPNISIPNPNYLLCPSEKIELSTTQNNLYTYQWLKEGVVISGANNSKVFVKDIGNYTVKVKGNNSCEIISEIYKVELKPICGGTPLSTQDMILCANAFTPNSDGHNDVWQIVNIEKYIDAEIFVYNRWGKLVFYSKGYSTKWDGMYNGELVPIGYYSYIIKPNIGTSDVKGAVFVLY